MFKELDNILLDDTQKKLYNRLAAHLQERTIPMCQQYLDFEDIHNFCLKIASALSENSAFASMLCTLYSSASTRLNIINAYANLNTVIQPGIYHCATPEASFTILNSPANTPFMMKVELFCDGVLQTFRSGTKQYTRLSKNGQWNGWAAEGSAFNDGNGTTVSLSKQLNFMKPSKNTQFEFVTISSAQSKESLASIVYKTGTDTQLSFRFNKGSNREDASPEKQIIYSLPKIDERIDKKKFYSILTSKESVSVWQGGTGARNATQALHNLKGYSLGCGQPLKSCSLDSLIEPGVYSHNSASTKLTSSPTNQLFKLVVENLADTQHCLQTLTGNDSSRYVRLYAQGVWSAWKKERNGIKVGPSFFIRVIRKVKKTLLKTK